MKVKYNKINIMLPTYKRVSSVENFLNSVYDTVADEKNICFTFCVNEEDIGTQEYIKKRFPSINDQICIVLEDTQQPNLSLYFNKMYDETVFNEEDTLVSMVGDDMEFKTAGWDVKVLESANTKNGEAIIYCDDDFIAHDKCCVNLFTSRKLIEATKKPFMCEAFHAEMIDVIWYEVGIMSNTLCYLNDVVIKHNHQMSTDPSKWDETMKRLDPIRRMNRTKENHAKCKMYSAICAKNLILGGIGKWNLL